MHPKPRTRGISCLLLVLYGISQDPDYICFWTDLIFDHFTQDVSSSSVLRFTWTEIEWKSCGGRGFSFLTVNILHVLESRLGDVHGHWGDRRDQPGDHGSYEVAENTVLQYIVLKFFLFLQVIENLSRKVEKKAISQRTECCRILFEVCWVSAEVICILQQNAGKICLKSIKNCSISSSEHQRVIRDGKMVWKNSMFSHHELVLLPERIHCPRLPV